MWLTVRTRECWIVILLYSWMSMGGRKLITIFLLQMTFELLNRWDQALGHSSEILRIMSPLHIFSRPCTPVPKKKNNYFLLLWISAPDIHGILSEVEITSQFCTRRNHIYILRSRSSGCYLNTGTDWTWISENPIVINVSKQKKCQQLIACKLSKSEYRRIQK